VLVATAFGSVARAQDFYPKETESYLINYMVRAKDPTAATILSIAPGFGAGHFYAQSYATGAVMLIGEALGLGLVLLAPHVEGTAGSILGISGGLIFAGFKIADIYLAPFSAADYNRDVAKSLKIKSLSGATALGPPPLSPGLALGLRFAGM